MKIKQKINIKSHHKIACTMRQGQFDYNNELSLSSDGISDDDHNKLLDSDDLPRSVRHTKSKEKKLNQNDDGIVVAENVVISRIKYFLFAFLLVTAIVVGTVIYLLAEEADDYKLEEDFVEFADTFYQSVSSSIDTSMSSIDNYIVNLVSHAEITEAKWPFVVLPHFSQKIRKIRTISRAAHFSQSHYVRHDQRLEWENFTANNNQWVQEVIEWENWMKEVEMHKDDESSDKESEDKESNDREMEEKEVNDEDEEGEDNDTNPNHKASEVEFDPEIHNLNHIHDVKNIPIQYDTNISRIYLPMWQNAPIVSNISAYNLNMERVFSKEQLKRDENDYTVLFTTEAIHSDLDWSLSGFIRPGESVAEPVGVIYFPILDTAVVVAPELEDENNTISTVVGQIRLVFFWREHLANVFFDDEPDGFIVVFENDCNSTFTYRIEGSAAKFMGLGDRHDPKYNHLMETKKLSELKGDIYSGLPVSMGLCEYRLSVYPSDEMTIEFETNNPIMFTTVAVSIFLFTILIFTLYDCWVGLRQRRLLKVAQQSSAVLTSLFPSNVRDRLFPMQDQSRNEAGSSAPFRPIKSRLRSYLDNDAGDTSMQSAPIADFFPASTVLFEDISGFTAWSSMREPTQVFVLLESIYSEFDILAEKRGVFKIETIGDSYVAVTGVPAARVDHAIVMTKFAIDCRTAMKNVTQRLASTLGPDTADLKLRIGLHSGPVTAGVLRGLKGRFQLFGDTMNTASRLESNGIPGKIQVSQATADLLIKGGKGDWLIKRDEMILAKGKGKMQTYFVEPKRARSSTTSSDSGGSDIDVQDRNINWFCDIFETMICQIINRREINRIPTTSKNTTPNSLVTSLVSKEGETILQQVVEVIELPELKLNNTDKKYNAVAMLNDVQRSELRLYVSLIAALYKKNPFHNLDHASHVTMSVVKLLGRIVAPDAVMDNLAQQIMENNKVPNFIASTLHDHTYGITSDPLTQFACVFASFIHDVDHPGVSNAQFTNENSALAALYSERSVAEQNSLDIAWNVLMQENYSNLRLAIFGDRDGMFRFRQLIINSVMATDIMDKELNAIRNKCWDSAFQNDQNTGTIDSTIRNRRATVIIEHLIQASDVAHTMQHWHIYRMWNERLFEEMYTAYQTGRAKSDPSTFWYQGELNFFDYYVIPLAKKLHDCGVFGVSSQEYLNYAETNREEWESRGEEIVTTMIEKYKNVTGSNSSLISV